MKAILDIKETQKGVTVVLHFEGESTPLEKIYFDGICAALKTVLPEIAKANGGGSNIRIMEQHD